MNKDTHQALVILQLGFIHPQGTDNPNFIQTTLSQNEKRDSQSILYMYSVLIKRE